jgi:hypothetical protein
MYFLATHFRTSSSASMAKAKGMTNSQTFSPMGAVPNIRLPHGV